MDRIWVWLEEKEEVAVHLESTSWVVQMCQQAIEWVKAWVNGRVVKASAPGCHLSRLSLWSLESIHFSFVSFSDESMTKLTHRALHKAFILSSHAPYDTSIFMVEGIATMVEGIATMVEGIATIVEGMGSDHKLTVERLFASP